MTEVKYIVFASVPTKIEVEALNEEDENSDLLSDVKDGSTITKAERSNI